MTQSNSENMTLTDIIVQHLKENKLSLLIPNEDKLNEVAQKAISLVLFGRDRYGADVDQSIYKTTQEILRDPIKRLIEDKVTLLLSDPKVNNAIDEAILNMIPKILADILQNNLYTKIQQNNDAAISTLYDEMKTKLSNYNIHI